MPAAPIRQPTDNGVAPPVRSIRAQRIAEVLPQIISDELTVVRRTHIALRTDQVTVQVLQARTIASVYCQLQSGEWVNSASVPGHFSSSAVARIRVNLGLRSGCACGPL